MLTLPAKRARLWSSGCRLRSNRQQGAMSVKAAVILISNPHESHWLRILEKALVSIATLEVAAEAEAIECVLRRRHDLIIVDATSVDDPPYWIARIRDKQPDARVIVVTASPTWTLAREAFRAGAMDYIGKSTSLQELHSTFANILMRS